MGVRVVELGAICDLDREDPGRPGREHSFSVTEFAVTDDGRRVTLHRERGWGGRLSTDDDIWRYTTAEELKETVTHGNGSSSCAMHAGSKSPSRSCSRLRTRLFSAIA